MTRVTGAVSFRALVDPQFDQPELFGREIDGGGFVSLRRHGRVGLVRRHLEQPAFASLLWLDGRAVVAALEHGLRRLQIQAGLGGSLVVADETIGLENRQHLALEIHRAFVLNRGDGNGGGRLWFCGERNEPGCEGGQAGQNKKHVRRCGRWQEERPALTPVRSTGEWETFSDSPPHLEAAGNFVTRSGWPSNAASTGHSQKANRVFPSGGRG